MYKLSGDKKVKMTDSEIKEHQLAQQKAQEFDQKMIKEFEASEQKKASAKKKLEDLGLTTEEIKEAFGI
jgi:hypothetical protein